MDVAKFCAYIICNHFENVEGFYCIFIPPKSDGCLPNHRVVGLDSQYSFDRIFNKKKTDLKSPLFKINLFRMTIKTIKTQI